MGYVANGDTRRSATSKNRKTASQNQRTKTMKKAMLVIVALVALVAVKASAQTDNGGDLLSMTELGNNVLQVTYDNQALPVTTLGQDWWTFANPFPDNVYLFPTQYAPAVWKEPDWSTDGTWNRVDLDGDFITVQSDIWGDFALWYSFENGATHVLDTYDSLDGTPGGGGPGTENVIFLDIAGNTINEAPDGGLTAMLLGVSFCGLTWVRRKLS
jgi:hypothetical protein